MLNYHFRSSARSPASFGYSLYQSFLIYPSFFRDLSLFSSSHLFCVEDLRAKLRLAFQQGGSFCECPCSSSINLPISGSSSSSSSCLRLGAPLLGAPHLDSMVPQIGKIPQDTSLSLRSLFSSVRLWLAKPCLAVMLIIVDHSYEGPRGPLLRHLFH